MNNHNNISVHTRKLCLAAVLMSCNIILSSIGVPVPGGHLYFNDTVIVASAILLDPFYAFLVGGVGAFLGDFFFYPAPMFVSLVTHGLQALVISWCAHHLMKGHKVAAAMVGAILGGIIMVIGYSLGRAFVYATPEYAIIKLPFEILQASLGIVFGPFWSSRLTSTVCLRKLHNLSLQKQGKDRCICSLFPFIFHRTI